VKPELVVMAAGMGSRFGGFKQAEPVGPCGEMLLDYSVFDALRAGVERLVLVIRRDIERDFRRRVGRRLEGQAEVVYAFQEVEGLPAGFFPPPGREKPWGTSHALLAAAPHVRAPFLAVNADDFYGAEGFRLLAGFLAEPSPGPPEGYALVAHRLDTTLSEHGVVSRGVCSVSPAGLLLEVTEYTEVERLAADGPGPGVRAAPPGTLGGVERQAREGTIRGRADGVERRFTGEEPVSVNFWGLRPGLFPLLEERFVRFLRRHGGDPRAEHYLPTAVGELVREGLATVRVFRTAAPWFGMTHKEDLPLVARRIRELVERGLYPAPLWG
jgi:hypothetical protein